MTRMPLLAALAGALFLPVADTPDRAANQDASAVPPVVDGAWLAARLGQPGLVILHVGDARSYAAEHLPGAQHVTFEHISTADSDTGLALELPPADVLRERLERLGISDDSRIVVYFAGNWATPATRVVFTLDYLGLGARTALLDGGIAAWKREGRPVTSAVATVTAGTLAKRAPKPAVVDAEFVRTHAKRPGYRVIDARAPVFFSGRGHGDHRPGHVPGAVNVPYTSVFTDSLRVVSRDSLERLFAAAGVQKGDTILAYCHIGQQATAIVFAARLLGRPVKLYDGSFQDWSRRSELPTEGGAPGDRR